MQVLLIGGNADGKRINIPDDMSWFNMPVHNESIGPTPIERYRVERWRSDGRETAIAIFDSMTAYDAFVKLVECYPSERNENDSACSIERTKGQGVVCTGGEPST